MRSPGSQGRRQGPSGKPLSCVNGFLLQFLNVHILMLGIAAYSGYILPHGVSGAGRAVLRPVIMAACAATGNLIWATLGALLILPLYNRYYKAVNVVMAAAAAVVRLEDRLPLMNTCVRSALPSREGVFCAEQACPRLLISYNAGRAPCGDTQGSGFWGIERLYGKICEKFAQTGRHQSPDNLSTLSSK